jgi:hypothetical protein
VRPPAHAHFLQAPLAEIHPDLLARVIDRLPADLKARLPGG